ncbi:MAG: endolytic transglycosylase MltG, partial [Anaerolineae bacterium]|nr:endolytic transglycosylase MltG [Anaerolineae bacterium]
DNRQITFIIEQGETVSTVAYHLKRMGLITDPELFRRVVQYWGADKDIQAGVYTLSPSMTMEEIMRQLQHGGMPTTTVTIPEGWRAEQIAALLEEVGITSREEFIQAVRRGRTDYDFLRDRPPGSPPGLEGFLFPDTYQFPQKANAEQIIDIMLQNWDRRVPPALRKKAAERKMTLYEVVTLASIVEREAVLDEERPLIASVYLNRLKKGMYLQADPTVQYAKGYDSKTGRWWAPMKQEEAITVVSPYNTFLHPGLPPGPICNPGLASIKAVLEPAQTEYLFFYHKGDGSHAFAVTYEEHLRNQELYGGR